MYFHKGIWKFDDRDRAMLREADKKIEVEAEKDFERRKKAYEAKRRWEIKNKEKRKEYNRRYRERRKEQNK